MAIFVDALEGSVGTLYLDVAVLDEDGPYGCEGARVTREQRRWYREGQELGTGRRVHRVDEGGWGEAGGGEGEGICVGEEKGVAGRDTGDEQGGLEEAA